ncbi:right-handed parallel beta-helix repeat-containing protein [Paenibacillus oryzisoli]|uniref:right-handed parallel beta-helix repeat-containing protein n=1 Tax=Paenibacillus oryzisoli TaxID=1850517 RepID=UPI003D26D0C0
MSILSIQDFGAEPNQASDATLAVFAALERCRELERPTLLFPEGTYHFWPEHAVERQLFIPNHDQDKNRRIAFPLFGMNGLTIDGQGSEFIFHGLTLPFVLDQCEDVTVRNVRLDWERPILSQGKVIRAGEGTFDVEIGVEYPFKIAGRQLVFIGEGWEEPCKGIIEMDLVTKTPAFQSGDYLNYGHYAKLQVEPLSTNVIRYSGAGSRLPKVGSVLIFQCGGRDCPGFYVNSSLNTKLEGVELHHAIGMGVIAQRSENITLRGVGITLRPGTSRLFTTAADATHFVYCRGRIEMEGCTFENQMDDPCNVHGIYMTFQRQISEDTLLLRLNHMQQRGAAVFQPGEHVRFIDKQSLLPQLEAVVKGGRCLNPEFYLLTFDRKLPRTVDLNSAVENMSWAADVLIRQCTARANRARGFLITTPGKVLIENNLISTPGSGIKISGDANHWFESGAVRDIMIRGNTFEDCNYCYPEWGSAAIDIDPEIQRADPGGECYHANIVIEGNRFIAFHPYLLKGRSVNGITFTNNVVVRSNRYPAIRNAEYDISLSTCKNITVNDNQCPTDAKIIVNV